MQVLMVARPEQSLDSTLWAVLKVDFMLTRPPLCWWKERLLPNVGRRSWDAIPKVGWLRVCCSPCTACSLRQTVLLSSAISVLVRELQFPPREVVTIKVILTGSRSKSLQVGCCFSHLGLCGVPATAGLFEGFLKIQTSMSFFFLIFLLILHLRREIWGERLP